VGPAIDLARGGVNGDELVGARGGSVNAIARGRKIKGIGLWADGDAGDVVGGRVENEDVAGGGGDTPDFIAIGVFTEIGDGGTDGNFANGLEFCEVDDGEGALRGGHVGVHVEVGAEEGRAMFTEEDDGGGDEEGQEHDVEAWVFGVRHVVKSRIAETERVNGESAIGRSRAEMKEFVRVLRVGLKRSKAA
jgi:hypothetical protein